MRFLLDEKRNSFNSAYVAGLASQIWVPLNAGRYVGREPVATSPTFKTTPDSKSINLAEWIAHQITLTNITFTGDLDFVGNVQTTGDLTFTETIVTPSTSASLSIKSAQVVHTITGGATEEIPVNIPDGAVILGASVLAATDLTFTTGTEVTVSWTNSTQAIGTTGLAAKNDKVTALYNVNADVAIAGGTPETITLTADAGTVDDGTVIATVWYMELAELADVA